MRYVGDAVEAFFFVDAFLPLGRSTLAASLFFPPFAALTLISDFKPAPKGDFFFSRERKAAAM